MKPSNLKLGLADLLVAIIVAVTVAYIAVKTEGVLVYSLIIGGSAIVSACYHYGLESAIRASLFSAVTVAVIALLGDAIWRGQSEPWLLVASALIGVIAFVTSLAVGYLMDRLEISKRKRKSKKS